MFTDMFSRYTCMSFMASFVSLWTLWYNFILGLILFSLVFFLGGGGGIMDVFWNNTLQVTQSQGGGLSLTAVSQNNWQDTWTLDIIVLATCWFLAGVSGPLCCDSTFNFNFLHNVSHCLLLLCISHSIRLLKNHLPHWTVFKSMKNSLTPHISSLLCS